MLFVDALGLNHSTHCIQETYSQLEHSQLAVSQAFQISDSDKRFGRGHLAVCRSHRGILEQNQFRYPSGFPALDTFCTRSNLATPVSEVEGRHLQNHER